MKEAIIVKLKRNKEKGAGWNSTSSGLSGTFSDLSENCRLISSSSWAESSSVSSLFLIYLLIVVTSFKREKESGVPEVKVEDEKGSDSSGAQKSSSWEKLLPPPPGKNSTNWKTFAGIWFTTSRGFISRIRNIRFMSFRSMNSWLWSITQSPTGSIRSSRGRSCGRWKKSGYRTFWKSMIRNAKLTKTKP